MPVGTDRSWRAEITGGGMVVESGGPRLSSVAQVDRTLLEAAVTRRAEPLFTTDFSVRQAEIAEQCGGKRILVVGGGGTIGSMTTRLLLRYGPAAVHVVDTSENYLAELVRTIRGSAEGMPPLEFRTLPIDYGSPVMERFLLEAAPYDIVLNFAALKHVRSEKDVYSLLQMFDTNLVAQARFKRWLARGKHAGVYFAVSTDKAANPTSLMGASKRLMEDLVFGIASDTARSTTSARFANVAFSNGSLLDGFRHRLEQRQPLAVPRDTRRYFVSQLEAGQLCVLAALAVPDRHIAFPKMDAERELQDLQDIAARVLAAYGLEPDYTEDEEQGRRSVEDLASRGRWPVILTPLDTSGEKPYEEFIGRDELAVDIGLEQISALKHVPSRAVEMGLFDRLADVVDRPGQPVAKPDIVRLVTEALGDFGHIDTGRNLDQRF